MTDSANFFANVDIVNFVIRGNQLHVSLWKRPHEPFAGYPALPGAIINGQTKDASLEDTVSRVIKERLGQEPLYIEQVMTVGNNTRDSRGWSMTTVYLAIHTDEGHAKGVDLVPYDDIASGAVSLPFDHRDLIMAARDRLKSKSTYSSLPILFIPRDKLTVYSLTHAYRLAVNDEVREITVRTRLKTLQEKGYIDEIGEVSLGQGRPKVVYHHNAKVHFFDRSITTSKS